jgi:SAM-dependent methyltransferase
VPSDNYAIAFGVQWLAFRRTQLDSYTGTTLSRDRCHRCLGPEVLAEIDRARAEGREYSVLEVGCGAGRFTEVLLDAGASVTSVDLSAAVEANQSNFPQSDRHRVIQADVYALPFVRGQFDLVFCLGVVQHTPDPERTIASLFEQVMPGGHLVLDHYAPALGWYFTLKPVYRAVLTRVPARKTLLYTERLVRAFLPVHSRLRHRRLALRALARISPVVCYYGKLPLSEAHHCEWALLDTHDALTDRYKHRRTPAQLTRAVRALGAEEIHCVRGGNGVELRCRRPAARPS